MMKRLLLFAGLLGSLVSVGAAPVTQLKVLSFNIWVNGGYSLSNCIEVIRTSGADIVGLQECNGATAGIIATNLGFEYLGVTDVSIVSRYPISAAIPANGGRGVTIELGPGQRVHLFNCHLAAYPYGPYDLKDGQSQSFILNQENQTRMPALNQLLSAMTPYVAGGEPCFLTGDFNAPSHYDYTSFPWPTSIACTNAGLVDSYFEIHPNNRKYPAMFAFDEPGITWTPLTSQEPNGVFDRIDFVYYSPGDGVTATNSAELDGRNSIGPWPSDHRAVLSTFLLTPPPLTNKASHPVPADGTTNVPLAPTLSWLPASNALSQTLYLGTNSPGTLRTNQTLTSFLPGSLIAGTKYYWRVDETTDSGAVTGDVWSFATTGANAAVYEWNFNKADLSPALGNGVLSYADGDPTKSLTSFGTTDGSTVPHIGGQPATYLRAPGFTATGNGYQVSFSDSGPNGGGVYLNQFTMIFDLLVPGSLGWVPLFNTNPENANDADFYINNAGAVGIGAIGYSAAGVIAANIWYRIAFAADLSGGTVVYYVNGHPVFNGSASLDQRHSLYSNVDPGADLLLFNEGDTSAVYTHEVLLSSFFFTDRTMSAAELATLGGPKARGVAVPASPIALSISLQRAVVNLSWTGGEGPFRVLKTIALENPSWETAAGPTSTNETAFPVTGAAAYYRVATP